jgi:hypothetical protein
VFVPPVGMQRSESGEHIACRRRETSPSQIITGIEPQLKLFQPDKREKASNHFFGGDVLGIRKYLKANFDKVDGRQKKFLKRMEVVTGCLPIGVIVDVVPRTNQE